MTGPLSKLKVLDFSTLLPGPYASMMLADMGAEVLRVESPSRMDLLRVMPPMDGKHSASHSFLNRGKRSIGLNLKTPEAVSIIETLVKEYDIVLEQFRPGVMDRLGLGYAHLKTINPKLIYCSITGYGQTGCYKDRAGHDINFLAMSGIISYSGDKASGPPNLGFQLGDIAGGSHHAVMGILAAVIERQTTQQGQHIDVSMTDALFSMNAMSMAGYLAAGHEPEAEAGLLNGGSFYGHYETADGRYLSIGSLEPQFLKGLCMAIEREDLYSKGLSQSPKDQITFKSALKEVIKSRSFEEWKACFAKLDVCVEPVLSLAEAVNHPHFQERQMVIEVPRKKEAPEVQKQSAPPIKFSNSVLKPTHAGCEVGLHTEEVLSEDLGMDAETIQQLREKGVLS
jgi:crotonobetainyl-CoA:carnitine CoA-transferase CaiB-like acyl-CoA transferase